MSRSISRRELLAIAAACGAQVAMPGWAKRAAVLAAPWRERRDLYPQGVASGDPHPESVLLWTRRDPAAGPADALTLELARDPEFRDIVTRARVALSADNDWTARVLAAGLQPSTEYWFRFTDDAGNGSRTGRTLTAPAAGDPSPARFAFVSCQNMQLGAANAYRRMIYEDERRAAADRLQFVMHLGDFVYEVVWYPEDRPQGYYARRIRDILRYPDGEKIGDFHIPATLRDYRALYRAYLADPDLQDARARWPFIYMWDNHEFSWKGWQSVQNFGSPVPRQTRKVAANQAWFEYQPARVRQPGRDGQRFAPPAVRDAGIASFDDKGMGLEANNLAAIESLETYRGFRWGRHVDLILTDNRSFRSEPVMQTAAAAALRPTQFPAVLSQDVAEILDAGRDYDGGAPPTIAFGGAEHPNPRKTSAPQTILGARQRAWFERQLRDSRATWKLWGNSIGMLDWRLDFQNLPTDVPVRWPTTGFAQVTDDDWAACRHERAELLAFLERNAIANVALVCGDRHAFEAGVASASLPPKPFKPVAVEFVTGSVSAPGIAEAMEYGLPKDHPLRAVYVHQPPSGAPQPAIDMSLRYGVRTSIALQRGASMADALAQRNADLAPHLEFIDVNGHGYATVRAGADALDVEFVCIPRPIERSATADGGPLAYRIAFRVPSWRAGERPTPTRTRVDGSLPLGN